MLSLLMKTRPWHLQKSSKFAISDIKVLSGADSLEYVATLDSVNSVMAAIVLGGGIVAKSGSGKGG